MVIQRLEPQKLLRDPLALAGWIPAERVFTVLCRAVEVPTGWASLTLSHQNSRRLDGPGARIGVEDAARLMLARTDPIELDYVEKELRSADDYLFEARSRFRVALVPEPSEVAAFQRACGNAHGEVTRESVRDYLRPHLRRALSKRATGATAAELTTNLDLNEAGRQIQSELTPPCFEAGLQILEVPSVSVTSTAFRQTLQVEEQSRLRTQEMNASAQVMELRHQARSRQVERLEELALRLRNQADETGKSALKNFLGSLAEAERGELYLGLGALASREKRTRRIALVAGQDAYLIDPSKPDASAERVPGLADFGPLRSVNFASGTQGAPLLLIGAATGVHVVDVHSLQSRTQLVFPTSRPLRGGFNAAVFSDGKIFATHSELGIACWTLDHPDRPSSLFPQITGAAQTVRHTSIADGFLYFTINDQVLRAPLDDLSDSMISRFIGCFGAVTALAVTPFGVFAGDTRGAILRWRSEQPAEAVVVVSGLGRSVDSIAVLDTMGIARLFYADTTSAAHVHILDDTFTGRFEAGGQTIRWLAAADDLVCGVNESRDRLFLWDHGHPEQPRFILPIGRSLGRSIQDICLIPEPVSG